MNQPSRRKKLDELFGEEGGDAEKKSDR